MWAPAHLRQMKNQGAALFGVDFAASTARAFEMGLNLNTDYSGLGGPEVALQQVLLAVQEERPSIQDCVVVSKAGDLLAHCRSVLLQHSGPSKPKCVFGDSLDRCPPQLLKRVQNMQKAIWKRANTALAKGRAKREVIESLGNQFMAKALDSSVAAIGFM